MYPLLFDFGFWKIGSYGILAVAGLGFIVFLVRFYASMEKIDRHKLVDALLIAIVSGFFGSKILHVIISYKEIAANPYFAITILLSGGVYYGGLIAGVVVGFFYLKRKQLPVLKSMDALAPIAALGLGIGRIACFLSGCCFGKPTNVPWSVTFTNSFAHKIHPDLPSVPIHPTQLYEALVCYVIFIILTFILWKKKFDGQATLSFFFLYGIARPYLEMYRGDFRGSVFGLFSTSQFIGLATALISAVAYVYLWRKNRSNKHP